MTSPTEYTISAIEYSGDLKPWGDGYAPQIVLTNSGYVGWNQTEVNTESLPFDADYVETVVSGLSVRDLPSGTVERFFKIFYGLDVITKETIGYSQGDYGTSYVFGTPEYYELTGTDKVTESDHNDLCAWVWGDVYEVRTKAVTHTETCSLGHDHIITDEESELEYFIYGMDEAHKFATEHNIEIEGL